MNGKMLLDMATGEQGSINQSGKCGNTNGGQLLSSTTIKCKLFRVLNFIYFQVLPSNYFQVLPPKPSCSESF
ncbi:hypothetical protein BLOT_007274 [Blomia tropicalis]|nr:hypothetical protein BLOT_007274 [Blomia tropicalis]